LALQDCGVQRSVMAQLKKWDRGSYRNRANKAK
jgi:hypothetical protein